MTATQKKDAEANLLALRKRARDDGDWDAYDAANDKLMEVRAVKVAPKKIAVPKIEDELSVEDDEAGATLSKWAAEKNEDGSLKRPWAHPNHPKYARATQIGAGVFSDDDFSTTEDKLAEIDRLMAPKGQAVRTNAVLGTSNGKTPAQKTKLSDEQKKIAHRWYQDLEPAEAEKKWAAAMAKAPKSHFNGASGNA
jgi:hypothetical protein